MRKTFTQEIPVTVSEDGKVYTFTADNDVVRGGIAIQKRDSQTGETPQGNADFAGIVFEIVNSSANAVVVDDKTIAPNEVVATITTDENGYASTEDELLPYGHYTVREKSTNASMLLTFREQTVDVTEDKKVYNVYADNDVVRGGLSVQKLDSKTGEKPQGDANFAGIVFEIILWICRLTITPVSKSSMSDKIRSFNSGARILNERDIPSPGRLRFERGIITNNNKKGKDLPWNRHVLSDLLKNVVYIGHLAQGRSSSALYQGIPYHWVDEAEWDVAENTHEPIISMELWDRVQAVNAQSRKDFKDCYGKYHYLAKRENPYGELLRCADCGRVIKQVHSYSKSGKKVYFNYKCPNNIELGDAACPKKSIRADDLDAAVLTLMRRQMELFLDSQAVLKECLADVKKKAPAADAENQAREIRQAIDKRTKQSTGLYGDYKDGVLSKEEYLYAKKTYQDEVERLRQELREMEEVRRSAGNIAGGRQNWARLVRKYAKARKVSGEMVRAMIKSITLYADNSISVEFLYMDEFEKIRETCARLRGEVA